MQAMRIARPRVALRNWLRLSYTTSQVAPSSTRSSTARTPIPLSNVEAQWEKMTSDEQLDVHKQLEELQKKDWKHLSLDEKKAAYYVSFGPHGPRTPINPPGTWLKVFLGTVTAVTAGVLIFTAIHHFSPPPPRTMTREWQEESNRRAIETRQNPISGITSEGYKGKGHVQSK